MQATALNTSPPGLQQNTERLLLEGAMACARRYGMTKINIKRVAEECGVTRQTVYRYYPSSQALVEAVSWHVVSGIIQQLDKHLTRFHGFDNKVVESIIFLSDKIPKDPYLNQYFSTHYLHSQNMEELFSDTTLQYCQQYLHVIYGEDKLAKDKAKWLDSLAELLLRTIVSLIVTPSKRTSGKKGRLEYLNLWLKPLLAEP